MKNIKIIMANNNVKSLIGSSLYSMSYVVTVLILARTYSQEIFGQWMLFFESVILMQIFMYGLFSVALIRSLSIEKTKNACEVVIGSNWVISLVATMSAVLIFYLALALFYTTIIGSNFKYVFIYLPVYAICLLPMQNWFSILQAENKFKELYFFKWLQTALFMGFVVVNHFTVRCDIEMVICANIASVLVLSIYSLKYSGICFVNKYSSSSIKKLLHFSKYTLMTNVGGGLLKSSDLYIIGLLLTNIEVAVYSIPLKLIDLYNVPLNGLSAVAFPMMSRLCGESTEKVKRAFSVYAVFITVLFIPVLVLLYVFAEQIVYILGGEGYVSEVSVAIFRNFVIFGLFLPIDRFTGITLDSINKPQYNFFKVKIMLILNIVGDFVAITYFDSLIGVSYVTIMSGILGVVAGFVFVHKEIGVTFDDMIKSIKIKDSCSYLFIKQND